MSPSSSTQHGVHRQPTSQTSRRTSSTVYGRLSRRRSPSFQRWKLWVQRTSSETAPLRANPRLSLILWRRLNITTIDRDTLYHLYEQTKVRRTFNRGVHQERLVRGNPKAARVHAGSGTRGRLRGRAQGKLGLQLGAGAQAANVALVAFHDSAQVWDAALYNEMMADPSILMTAKGASVASLVPLILNGEGRPA